MLEEKEDEEKHLGKGFEVLNLATCLLLGITLVGFTWLSSWQIEASQTAAGKTFSAKFNPETVKELSGLLSNLFLGTGVSTAITYATNNKIIKRIGRKVLETKKLP